MKNRLRAVLIVINAVLLFTAASTFAIPFDITHVYYAGTCSATANEVGWWNKACDGTTTQSGTQGGNWRVSTWYNCNTAETNTRYYRYCGGTWVEMTQAQFETACGCS